MVELLAARQRFKAPAFEAKATTGEPIRLADYRGKYLVLYFYPKAFTQAIWLISIVTQPN